MLIRPKDYIVIDDQYFFAVVSEYQEDQRALTWLRYVRDENGMQKLATEEAGNLVQEVFPELIFHSQYADIELHGIPYSLKHVALRPEDTVTNLLQNNSPDNIQQDAIHFIKLLNNAGIDNKCLGITGSLMLNTHNETSDIDMVIYGRDNFYNVRAIIKSSIKNGKLQSLDDAYWQDAYQRRDCSISFEEYQWHESRKFNKCISGITKVDISMIPTAEERANESGPFKKCGHEKLETHVLDDTYSYDFPARYIIEHEQISEIVSYTATYTGQAEKGETIEAAGYVEQGSDGTKRLLVGSSREADGEYIKVIN